MQAVLRRLADLERSNLERAAAAAAAAAEAEAAAEQLDAAEDRLTVVEAQLRRTNAALADATATAGRADAGFARFHALVSCRPGSPASLSPLLLSPPFADSHGPRCRRGVTSASGRAGDAGPPRQRLYSRPGGPNVA